MLKNIFTIFKPLKKENTPELKYVIYIRDNCNRKYFIDASLVVSLIRNYKFDKNNDIDEARDAIKQILSNAYRLELKNDIYAKNYADEHNLIILNLLTPKNEVLFHKFDDLKLHELGINRIIHINNHYLDIDFFILNICMPRLSKLCLDNLDYTIDYLHDGLVTYDSCSRTFRLSAPSIQQGKEYLLTAVLDIRDYEPYTHILNDCPWERDIKQYDACMYKVEWVPFIENTTSEILLYKGHNCKIESEETCA